jgi:hypothetical protein
MPADDFMFIGRPDCKNHDHWADDRRAGYLPDFERDWIGADRGDYDCVNREPEWLRLRGIQRHDMKNGRLDFSSRPFDIRQSALASPMSGRAQRA